MDKNNNAFTNKNENKQQKLTNSLNQTLNNNIIDEEHQKVNRSMDDIYIQRGDRYDNQEYNQMKFAIDSQNSSSTDNNRNRINQQSETIYSLVEE